VLSVSDSAYESLNFSQDCLKSRARARRVRHCGISGAISAGARRFALFRSYAA